jgi:hypothetical protein
LLRIELVVVTNSIPNIAKILLPVVGDVGTDLVENHDWRVGLCKWRPFWVAVSEVRKGCRKRIGKIPLGRSERNFRNVGLTSPDIGNLYRQKIRVTAQ